MARPALGQVHPENNRVAKGLTDAPFVSNKLVEYFKVIKIYQVLTDSHILFGPHNK